MRTNVASAARLFELGRFVEAEHHIGTKDTDAGLAIEIHYFRGDAQRVRSEGRRLLQAGTTPDRTRGRVSRVLAAQLRDDGHFEDALSLARAAVQFSTDPSESALAHAELLEAECVHVAFDAARPAAMRARRCALRAADPRVLAQVHLVFGRLEARAGHWDRALRHFALVRKHIEEAPSLFLEACAALDESSTRFLLGDFTTALHCATEGSRAAHISGWLKGRAVAAANSAYFAVRLGQLADAERYLTIAEAEPFRSPSLQIALIETRSQLAVLKGDLDAAATLLAHDRSLSKRVFSWYSLSLAESEIRLQLRRAKWHSALASAERALALAAEHGMHAFEPRLQLQRAIALHGLGRQVPARDLTIAEVGVPLAAGSTFWLTRAVLAGPNGRPFHARVLRIGAATGDAAVTADVEPFLAAGSLEDTAPPTLETAVALLDLAEHPHVLAREALAVVAGSGCVDFAALVARNGRNIRVLHTWQCDERAALRTAAESRADTLDCGAHDEATLHVVARVRDDVESRFAWGTIRRLLAAAGALGRFTRDEKARAALWPAESLDGDPDSIWVSESIRDVLRTGQRIAPSGLPVLLTGESGTGKEMMARAIHAASGRAGRLLAFNCTAVPRDMFESQLFGFRKGSFTGADAAYPGIIRAAEGGTLFLDEIGDVPLELQPKLLRFIEQREIQPIGEPAPLVVDVHIIAATNVDLERLVQEKRIREDLYYRLSGMRLQLPPLRERREEIPALVEHYIRRFAQQQKKTGLALGDEALEYLLLYPWPGNLRQLANEVHRMVALADSNTTFTPAHLSPEIQATRRTVPAADAEGREARIPIDQPLPRAIEQLERVMVDAALKKTGGLEEAAQLLGISRKGLFLKRRRWGVSAE